MSGRVPIQIRQVSNSALVCASCSGPMVVLTNKQHTDIYYCSHCDLYCEATRQGVILRSYREPQVNFIQGGQDAQRRPGRS